ARELADADTAFLALPIASGDARIEAADGTGASTLRDEILPARSVTAAVMLEGRVLALPDGSEDDRVLPIVREATGCGPILYVPVGVDAETAVGTLVVT